MPNPDSLIPNVTCKSTSLPLSFSLSLSVPLVNEVIYKYHKQQEAEHLHKQEVIISLFTHRPVMMGAVVGFTLLSGMRDPLGKESYWPLP